MRIICVAGGIQGGLNGSAADTAEGDTISRGIDQNCRWRSGAESIDELKDYGFSSEELYRLVAPRRTLARRLQKKEPLTVRENDNVQRIIHISEMADRIFGERAKAQRWLRKPSRALNGVVPLELLVSETGARLVEEELYRIEYGIYI